MSFRSYIDLAKRTGRAYVYGFCAGNVKMEARADGLFAVPQEGHIAYESIDEFVADVSDSAAVAEYVDRVRSGVKLDDELAAAVRRGDRVIRFMAPNNSCFPIVNNAYYIKMPDERYEERGTFFD